MRINQGHLPGEAPGAEESIPMGSRGGSYALLLECPRRASARVGALGILELIPGWYVYLGSAFGPGGVRARCLRHWRGGRPHWHMDHLRPLCRLDRVWFTHDPVNREHQWARLLAGLPGARQPHPGFGSSDCRCPSHLVWFPTPPSPAVLADTGCKVASWLPESG